MKTKLHKGAVPTVLPSENGKDQLAASLECEKQGSVFREGGIVWEDLVR